MVHRCREGCRFNLRYDREARDKLRYDPRTGELRQKADTMSSFVGGKGEPGVQLQGHECTILAKRAVWAMMTGEFPAAALTYRNGNSRGLRWYNVMTT